MSIPTAADLLKTPGECKSTTGNVGENYGLGVASSLLGMVGLGSLVPSPTANLQSALSQAQTKLNNVYMQNNSKMVMESAKIENDTFDTMTANQKAMTANINYHAELINEELATVDIVLMLISMLVFIIIFYILFT